MRKKKKNKDDLNGMVLIFHIYVLSIKGDLWENRKVWLLVRKISRARCWKWNPGKCENKHTFFKFFRRNSETIWNRGLRLVSNDFQCNFNNCLEKNEIRTHINKLCNIVNVVNKIRHFWLLSYDTCAWYLLYLFSIQSNR